MRFFFVGLAALVALSGCDWLHRKTSAAGDSKSDAATVANTMSETATSSNDGGSVAATSRGEHWSTSLFRGTIGRKIRIRMRLEKNGNALRGVYRYQKSRDNLRLSGAVTDAKGTFDLEEKNAAGAVTGHFHGVLESEGCKGTWTSPDGKRTLPFALGTSQGVIRAYGEEYPEVIALDGGMRRGTAAAGAAADRIGAATDRTVADASQAARAMDRQGLDRQGLDRQGLDRQGLDRQGLGSQSSMQWPYWLLALAVLGGLGWYFFGDHGDRQVAEQNVPVSTSRPPETVGLGTPSLNAGGVDLGRQVSSSVGALTSALAGITDVTSAQAALPKIRDAKLQLDRVSALSSQLSPDGKRMLASLVAASMPALNRLCAKILSMPEVGNLAKPTIDELRTRLDSLVTA